jgi:hypothetical protein
MSFKISIDASKIASAFKEVKEEIEQDILKGVDGLAAMTTAKIDEMAAEKLHTTLNQFQKGFKTEEIAPHVHLLTIDESALWIEEGISAGTDMKDALLKNAPTNPRTGNKSRAIPFEHSKAPSQMDSYAQSLVTQIRTELKARKIPFKKIETGYGGNPRLGKLHSFSIPSAPPTSRANTDALSRVTIYQRKNQSTGKVQRDIMTFRTVSSGPASAGKWIHPGYDAQHFFEKAYEWALKEWETNILPQILAKY